MRKKTPSWDFAVNARFEDVSLWNHYYVSFDLLGFWKEEKEKRKSNNWKKKKKIKKRKNEKMKKYKSKKNWKNMNGKKTWRKNNNDLEMERDILRAERMT